MHHQLGACARTPDRGQLRGPLTGAAIGALTVAAHGLAGGGFPDSTALTLLAPPGALCGMLAARLSHRAGHRGRAGLFAVLAGGQAIGHAVLAGTVVRCHDMPHAATGHASDAHAVGEQLPSGWMLLAHAVATLLCTVLIAAADRLYDLVSHAIRVVTGAPATPPPRASRRWPAGAQTTRRFVPGAAVGPRAPPVSA